MSRDDRADHGQHPESCRDMVEYLSDYVDGDLDAALRDMIEAHGGKCPPCRAFIRTLSATVLAVRALPREPLDPRSRRALLQALRAARQQKTP